MALVEITPESPQEPTPQELKKVREDLMRIAEDAERQWLAERMNQSTTPPKIVYAMNFYEERMPQVKQCIERVRPYVDRCVLVYDDTVTEESKKWLKQWGCKLYYRKWDNHFSKQRNAYLEPINEGEWVLVSDPDELFCTELLKDLRKILTEAQKSGINILGINAHDITTELDGKVTRSVSDWFKQLLFQYEEGVRYVGCVHETLLPGVHGWRAANLDKRYYYEHIKSMIEIKERGARNVFCGGGGNNVKDKNPMYVELHEIVKKFNIKEWPGLRDILRNPEKNWNLFHEIKGVAIKHRSDSGWDYENESRDLFLWLKTIHPFEMTRASLYIDKMLNSCGILNCPLGIFKQNVNTLDDITMRRLNQIWLLEKSNLKVLEDGEEITPIKLKNTIGSIENFIKKNLGNMSDIITRRIQESKEENICEERLKLLKDLETNVNDAAIKICEFLKPTIESLNEKSLEILESTVSQKKKLCLEKCKSCVLTAIELFIGNTPIESRPQPPSVGSPPEVMAYVEEQYLKVLGRNADDQGKHFYTESILRGTIRRENLPKILMESTEYKEKHALQ